MIFQKKQVPYPGHQQNNSSTKKILLLGLSALSLLLLLIATLTGSRPKNSTNDLSPTSLSAFESENISINVPEDFELANEGGRYTFSSKVDENNSTQEPSTISIYPYSKSAVDFEKLTKTTTEDLSGKATGTAERVQIGGKEALLVKTKKDSEGVYMQRLFVKSVSYTWVVKALYYDEKEVLAKNLEAIFNSFRIGEEG